MQRVVITGAGGLIGSRLSKMLSDEGYDVVHLTRSRKKGDKYKSFMWDPEAGICDADAFNAGDIIIHLAGANIGEKRWSPARKREILDSRIKTAGLLSASTVSKGIFPSAFISASATRHLRLSHLTEDFQRDVIPRLSIFLVIRAGYGRQPLIRSKQQTSGSLR